MFLVDNLGMTARQAHRQANDSSLITEIRARATDPNMREVRVGRKTFATVRVADIESLGLRVGQRLTSAVKAQIDEVISINRARRIALGLLGKRGYSAGELQSRLARRGVEQGHARALIAELQRDGWLDERAYAEDVVRATVQKAPAARALIETRLAGRMVDPEVAQSIAIASTAGQDDHAAALALARRRLAAMARLPRATAARRLAGVLARRGFDEAVIADTLDALDFSLDSSDAP
jgi:regulatory protein